MYAWVDQCFWIAHCLKTLGALNLSHYVEKASLVSEDTGGTHDHPHRVDCRIIIINNNINFLSAFFFVLDWKAVITSCCLGGFGNEAGGLCRWVSFCRLQLTVHCHIDILWWPCRGMEQSLNRTLMFKFHGEWQAWMDTVKHLKKICRCFCAGHRNQWSVGG